MKTFITTLFFACVQQLAIAQNVVQGEYFLDADAGFAQNKLISFTPADDGSFPFTVDLSGVSPGFHNLYIRTKDSNGKWSLTNKRKIEVLASEAANKITNGEYYFDADPGFGAANVIAISPEDSVILQGFTAVVSGLTPGYHKLYGRLKDMYGNWSLNFGRTIEVVKGIDNAVLLVEYFFDNDAGVGSNASITFANPLPDGTFAFNIPANQIPGNADTLFIRVKDSTNANWSLTNFRIGQITLPLTLLSFNATPGNKIVYLNWQTTNEINTAYFTIERSIEGTNFSAVGKVNAKGNSSTLNSYKYDDDISGVSSNKIYYRLKQEDKDGSITYSKIVMVSVNSSNMNFTIRPNPVKNYFTIDANSNINMANAILLIRDMAGQTIMKRKLLAGGSQIIPISALAKGVYLINVITETKTFTQKLVVE